MTNDEWVKEAERLAERLAMKARREAAYLGGPMAEKYTGERKAAQSLLMLHISARPEPQAAVSDAEIMEAVREEAHFYAEGCNLIDQEQMLRIARAVLAASRQVPVGWQPLTDEDRTAAFNSMPDMLDGFLKTWGWLHFAKAIEAKCREKNAPAVLDRVVLRLWRHDKTGRTTVAGDCPGPRWIEVPIGEPRQEEGESNGSR